MKRVLIDRPSLLVPKRLSVLAYFLAFLFLSGCGKKGPPEANYPLYLNSQISIHLLLDLPYQDMTAQKQMVFFQLLAMELFDFHISSRRDVDFKDICISLFEVKQYLDLYDDRDLVFGNTDIAEALEQVKALC